MSLNDKDPLPTTINSLATELIARIVRLSSPKPSWDNAVERCKLLCSLALVCRAFRGPAQEELFRHVVLPSLAASRAFVAVLKSRAGARFASIPRSLRAGEDGEDAIAMNKFAVPFFVKRCPRLESMWLLKIGMLDVAALMSGTNLKELYCFGCALVAEFHARKLEARALTRLGVRACQGDYNLNPQTFPTLKYLDISTPLPREVCMFGFTNSVGGQLSGLCVSLVQHETFNLRLHPTLFSNLIVLDSHLSLGEINPFLSSIPSHIRHLRAQAQEPARTESDDAWASSFIEDHLEELKYPCLKNLEHFRFPNDEYGRELDDVTSLVEELAEKRPKVRASLDDNDKGDRSIADYLQSADTRFNPAFWAFVDDAEAEEANRLEGA